MAFLIVVVKVRVIVRVVFIVVVIERAGVIFIVIV